MSDTPFFSIGIPVYNTAPYLQRCLDSIYAQEFSDIEIIFVDDGSTDDSLEVLNSFAEKDNRITVIHRDNDGPSSARNAFYYSAKGIYTYVLDSDDAMCDNALNNAYKHITENNYPDILHSGFIRVIDGEETLVPAVYPGDEFFRPELSKDERWLRIWLTKKTVDQIMTKYIKREFLVNNGITFTNRLFGQEDHEFNFNLCRKADTMIYADFFSFRYYKNRTNSISTRWSYKAIVTALSRWSQLYIDLDFFDISRETHNRVLEDRQNMLKQLRAGTLHFPVNRSKEDCFKLIDAIDYYFGKEIRKLSINTGSAVEKIAYLFYKIFGIRVGFKILYGPFYKYLKLKKIAK